MCQEMDSSEPLRGKKHSDKRVPQSTTLPDTEKCTVPIIFRKNILRKLDIFSRKNHKADYKYIML